MRVGRLAPGLTLALSLAACGGRAPEAVFLNFDPLGTPRELTRGWSAFERTGAGETYVWAQARTATITLRAGRPDDRIVRFRAWPFRYPGAPPQQVTVALNDVTLGTFPLPDGPSVVETPSPAAAWKDGWNVLTFDFAYAEAPRERIAGADDGRTLAAGFDWLEVLPVPADGVPARP
ncbi:MAG: hypothetical protein RBU36_03775 [Thermoanaerobaculia bacterium]|nr:hypothetical protein [Thermoanaerobaculia bacterium]